MIFVSILSGVNSLVRYTGRVIIQPARFWTPMLLGNMAYPFARVTSTLQVLFSNSAARIGHKLFRSISSLFSHVLVFYFNFL